jgi:hypothetical protein
MRMRHQQKFASRISAWIAGSSLVKPGNDEIEYA